MADQPATGSRDDLGLDVDGRPIVIDSVEDAIADIAAGRPVVVVDDEDRENEGDIIVAADFATSSVINLMITQGRGLVCLAMTAQRAAELDLPDMVRRNQDHMGTAFTVSVDATPEHGVSTGISASDRARTVQVCLNGTATDLNRPGHVFPLVAREGGVVVRPGHTEAAVDLARLAGCRPAGVIVEVIKDDGEMARLPDLAAFARRQGLRLITIEDLIAYRARTETFVERIVTTTLPTSHGRFTAHGYRTLVPGRFEEQMVLVHGDLGDGEDVLVRLHSECLTGDVFGSRRCDCGPQLNAALDAVVAEGRGVVVYLRGHEGRGIGLVEKLRAYALQDAGEDTVEANRSLGLPDDAREYTAAAHMLRDLGVGSVRLLTNNPAKGAALTRLGIPVTGRVPIQAGVTDENAAYLRTKAERMGHDLPWLNQPAPTNPTPNPNPTPCGGRA